MTLEELLQGPPVQLGPAKVRSLDAVQKLGWTTAAVDLEDGTKKELLEKMGRALRFPSHFGHNWDALKDCLASVDATGGLILEIRGADKLDPADRAVLEDVVEDAAAILDESGLLLRVLLTPSEVSPRRVAR